MFLRGSDSVIFDFTGRRVGTPGANKSTMPPPFSDTRPRRVEPRAEIAPAMKREPDEVQSSTIVTAGSTAVVSEQREEQMPALMIAWSAAEPERVGEVALFEAGTGALILGRGAGESGGRVVFHRQRPGATERTEPLASPGLSREQLRIRFEGGRLRVVRAGKCAMEVAGERVEEASLRPGDTLLLKGQMLFLCVLRPRRLAPLQSASAADFPAFGAPDIHGIVGESPAVWRLRDQLAWLAKADEHTLVLGGSGSGKELCARAVHALSRRAGGPFVGRNAATIPEGLIDA